MNNRLESRIFADKKKEKLYTILIYSAISIVVFALTFYLFHRQAMKVYPENIENDYYPYSDFPEHIVASLEGRGYSINVLLLKAGYFLTNGIIGCVFVMSLVSVISLFSSAYFMKTCVRLNSNKTRELKLFLPAASVCFIGSVYIPVIYPFYYIDKGIGFTQPWHNSTYLIMRLLGLLTLATFFKIQSHYTQTGITLKEWLTFFVLLTLTNYAKPNFFIAFAPAMLCVLLYDFVKSRGKTLKQAVIFGTAVLCSMPILIFQLGRLYPSDTSEPSGVVFSPQHALSVITGKYFIPSIVASCSFVIAVTVVCIVKKLVNRELIFGWVAFIISIIEKWFIIETGPRANHGNFDWGPPFFALVLTLICIERLIMLKKSIKFTYIFMFLMPLFLMLASGFGYFIACVLGGQYYK